MPNDAAAPTQGGFLDLFADKIALARALLQRYLEAHARILDPLFARAGVLTDDPMQRMLIGLKLFAEPLENMPDGHLGCMAAAVCWQERLLDAEVRERSMSGLLNWRARFLAMFTGIAAG